MSPGLQINSELHVPIIMDDNSVMEPTDEGDRCWLSGALNAGQDRITNNLLLYIVIQCNYAM